MLSPIITLFKHFPFRAYSTVLIMLLIGWYTFRRIRSASKTGVLSVSRGIQLWLLINYIVLLLFFSVFGRRSLDYDRFCFEAGYSYRDVFLYGDLTLAPQIIANIVVFSPIGCLVSLLCKRYSIIKALLFGFAVSFSIEALQFLLRCGTVETDDLISNMLGTTLGCIAALIYRHSMNKRQTPSDI